MPIIILGEEELVMEIWMTSENKTIIMEVSDGKKEERTCSL